jgi:hypothetical protein
LFIAPAIFPIQVLSEARGKYENNNSVEALSDLKARLVAFRGRQLNELLPDVEKPVSGRLGDITHPLLQVAKLLPGEASEGLMALIGYLEIQRQDDQGETLVGRIAKATYDLRNDIVNGRLPVSRLGKVVNQEEGEKFSAQAIGRELNAMGIKKIKSGGGRMHIRWDQKVMEAIWQRYGVGEEGPPLFPQPP